MPCCTVLDICGMKSIVQDLDNPKCFVCGKTVGLELHHMMHGVANRRLATRYGLVCWLCKTHHTGQYGVHSGNTNVDRELQRVAQTRFEEIHGHAKWMEVFKKNYL